VTATIEREREGSAPAAATAAAPKPRRRRALLLALAFLAPAVILLGALVLYPIVYTVVRSFYGASGDRFVGFDNFTEVFESSRTQKALRNNLIWVLVAPAIATGIGLVLAVLAERVRWQTAFKVAVFMPMAISFLAAGVIFRIVYEENPRRGVANAVVTSVEDAIRPPGDFPDAIPSDTDAVRPSDGGFATTASFGRGDVIATGLVAIPPDDVPSDARQAVEPDVPADGLGGVVWRDFTPGGGGARGAVDEGEVGLPGVDVDVRRGGETVATATTDARGAWLVRDLPAGTYGVALPSSNFREPASGVNWLGPSVVTPAIIAAFCWIWVGFALIVIGAGLAAIPRQALEAARVDGANEWQVFRRVTAPLLWPVLLVVLVTLVINVLKIFDLVFVIAPGSSQDDANVLALEMWRVSFGGARDLGLGSALAVLLFVLVVPAMLFNIRRMRREAAT
jgi:alpha-glucoside transport system permease protein